MAVLNPGLWRFSIPKREDHFIFWQVLVDEKWSQLRPGKEY